MSRLSIACVLISFIPLINVVEAIAATIDQNFDKASQKPIVDSSSPSSSAPVKTSQNSNVVNSSPSECIIYAATTDLLTLEAVVSIYSTYSYESYCPAEANNSLKQASLEAQLKSIQSISLGVVNGGIHYSAADRNLTRVPNPFFYFGKLKYSKVGEVRVGGYEMFIAKGAPSTLLGLSNTYYKPIEYISKLFNIWNTGSLAHILVSPAGDSYILSQYTDKILNGLNRTNMSNLKNLLRLPPGWEFENILLSEPVSIQASVQNNFKETILLDEFSNIYIKFKEGGLETP